MSAAVMITMHTRHIVCSIVVADFFFPSRRVTPLPLMTNTNKCKCPCLLFISYPPPPFMVCAKEIRRAAVLAWLFLKVTLSVTHSPPYVACTWTIRTRNLGAKMRLHYILCIVMTMQYGLGLGI